MRVIATARGYDNQALREPGDEFEMPDGSKASWFHPVGEAPPEKPRAVLPAGAVVTGTARTLSEVAGKKKGKENATTMSEAGDLA